MEEELKRLKESLNDVDSLNVSQDVKSIIKNEIEYNIIAIEFELWKKQFQ